MILDTCALLWVAQGGNPLSEVALQRIKLPMTSAAVERALLRLAPA